MKYMVENHFDHGFTISKKSVCFLFALFLSFFPSPNASANGQQRQISLAKPTRKGGAIKFHVEVVEKLPAVLFFLEKLIFFVVPEIHAVYWKIDFVNFLLGVIVFTSVFEGLVKTIGLSFI